MPIDPFAESEADPSLGDLTERLTAMGDAWRDRPLPTTAVTAYLRSLASGGRIDPSPYPLQEEYSFMETGPLSAPPRPLSRSRGWLFVTASAALVVIMVGALFFVAHGRISSNVGHTTTLRPTPQPIDAQGVVVFPTQGYAVSQIVAGQNGYRWYTATYTDAAQQPAWAIGRIAPDGTQSYYAIPGSTGTSVQGQSTPLVSFTVTSLIMGHDGALWFAYVKFVNDAGHDVFTITSEIERMSLDGRFNQFTVPFPARQAADVYNLIVALVNGPDGAIWFTAYQSTPTIQVLSGLIGRLTTSGDVHWAFTSDATLISGMTLGPDQHLWFASGKRIGRIDVNARVNFIAFTKTIYHLAFDAQGLLWFAAVDEQHSVFIGRYSVATHDTTYIALPDASQVLGFALDAHGHAWATTVNTHTGDPTTPPHWHFYRISDDGTLADVHLAFTYFVSYLTSGPDGKIWFGDLQRMGTAAAGHDVNALAYLTP